MGCNSDYMNPNDLEINISQVLCFLDELDGKAINKNHLRGFHPKAYCKHPTKGDLDQVTETLCTRLQATDVAKYSLEMQIWWRDHQAADKARLERELRDRKRQTDKEAALAKLTPYERELLGLK